VGSFIRKPPVLKVPVAHATKDNLEFHEQAGRETIGNRFVPQSYSTSESKARPLTTIRSASHPFFHEATKLGTHSTIPFLPKPTKRQSFAVDRSIDIHHHGPTRIIRASLVSSRIPTVRRAKELFKQELKTRQV
jgi:hypothetical protein